MAASVLAGLHYAWAGVNFRSGAVGGVLVDANGVLTAPQRDDFGRLRELRQQIMRDVPADVKQVSPMRMVSLRALEEAIAQRKQKAEMPMLTDEMNYLAGLTRIQFVFVFPEHNDIVLAGPAEGWKIDQRGFVVGAETGKPTLQLDHLLVALRTAQSAQQQAISCSIDPTEEGVRRFKTFMGSQRQFNPAVVDGAEQALGMQTITITGVPATSDFARVLVAADYRMKRLAMGFDQSPVKGMDSYLSMIASASAVPTNAMPRWWLAPNYDALLKDAEGLSWELRGQGVKVMTEDEIVAAAGTRQQTGKASLIAQRWADTMTEKYDELCLREPIFGDLRNVMDMAVVGALIAREGLTEKAGHSFPLLLNPTDLAVDDFPAPRQVSSKVSALKKGSNWIITASGGVEINSWAVAEKTKAEPAVATSRKQAAPLAGGKWWWD
jgi:hypothetical protein